MLYIYLFICLATVSIYGADDTPTIQQLMETIAQQNERILKLEQQFAELQDDLDDSDGEIGKQHIQIQALASIQQTGTAELYEHIEDLSERIQQYAEKHDQSMHALTKELATLSQQFSRHQTEQTDRYLGQARKLTNLSDRFDRKMNTLERQMSSLERELKEKK